MAFCKVRDLCVSPETTLRQVMERINVTLRSIALVVDADRRLLGTITDGDVRRALLSDARLDFRVSELLRGREQARPITAPVGSEPAFLLRLMRVHSVRQVPLLDGDGRVVDLVAQGDLIPDSAQPLQAMIMAGGNGMRLRPLTEDTPKPMLPVGGRPLMEIIVERLRRAGIKRVHVATHYKTEKIMDYFGDGDDFGVEMDYVTEDRPMGTAGAIGMIPEPTATMLVINGDILTDVDLNAMLAFHRNHAAALTVAVRKYDMSVPYGVLECDGPRVRSVAEKPVVNFFVSAGIYLLEPVAHTFVGDDERTDMTDLIRRLLDSGRTVVNFPLLEYWIDIGQPDDYLQAQNDVKNSRCSA
jgi:dTDP-glucose pyrophosphorylase/CBS domain-containing protein